MAKKELHEVISDFKKLVKELNKVPSSREARANGISSTQIAKFGTYNDLVIKAGFEPNYNPQNIDSEHNRPPKILLFDIETSAIVAHVWGGYEQNVTKGQVIQDWYVLSWAAKWLGEDKIFYYDVRNRTPNANNIDKDILAKIHALIAEADIIIGHNSDRFDIKKLNARFIKYKMRPLSHYKSVDTLKIARKHFKFTFNTLEYLAEYLGVTNKKGDHAKFPGQKLWNACMGSNKNVRLEAFNEMEAYNKLDVIVLEEVYNILAPFDPKLKFTSFRQITTCSCGNTKFIKDGFTYTANGCYQRYMCKICGKVFRDRENLIPKKIRNEGLI